VAAAVVTNNSKMQARTVMQARCSSCGCCFRSDGWSPRESCRWGGACP
jgi:hypothetical protein